MYDALPEVLEFPEVLPQVVQVALVRDAPV